MGMCPWSEMNIGEARQEPKFHGQERKAVRLTGKQTMQDSPGQAGSMMGRQKAHACGLGQRTGRLTGNQKTKADQEQGRKKMLERLALPQRTIWH